MFYLDLLKQADMGKVAFSLEKIEQLQIKKHTKIHKNQKENHKHKIFIKPDGEKRRKV